MDNAFTDEELAELSMPAPTGNLRNEGGVILDQAAIHRPCEATRFRLIAALRASQLEIDRLKGFLDDGERKRFEAEALDEYHSQK